MNVYLSILLPAYNAERYLKEAIDSTLAQTYADFELLLIDDGSTDDTLQIMREYEQQDERVRLITHANWGMGASLNHAIEEARHDWLVRMDADDVMLPYRLERQVAFVTENPDVGVASCLVEYIDATGRVIGKYTSDLTTREAFFSMRSKNTVIGFHHPGVIMRKDLVQQVGGYRPQYWSADDLDLWSQLAELNTVILVQPEYLVRYRIHGGSVSHKRAREQQMKVRWVEHSMLARRSGRRELTLEEFVALEDSMPSLVRANRFRTESGKIFYKAATLHYSSGSKPRTATHLLAAFALAPVYTFKELNKKLLHLRRGAFRRSAIRQPIVPDEHNGDPT